MKKYLVLAIIVASLMLVYVVNLYLDLPKESPVDTNPTTQNPTEQNNPDPQESTNADTPTPVTVPTTSPVVEQAPPTTTPSPQAMVDSVSVAVAESFPPQYFANIKGNFRNGCESIGDFNQSVSGNTITLNLNVVTVGEMCTQALVPFDVKFPINATNLAKGTYTLQVSGVSTTFDVQ